MNQNHPNCKIDKGHLKNSQKSTLPDETSNKIPDIILTTSGLFLRLHPYDS